MSKTVKRTLPSRFAKYSDLFEKLMDPTFLLDFSTFLVLDANPAALRLFESTLKKILGQSIFCWVNEHERKSIERALYGAQNSGQTIEVNSRFETNRNQFLIVKVVICTLKLSNNKEVLQFIAKDITEEHEAKQKSVNQLIKIAEMNRKLEMLSVTDEMTKLFNFRCFRDRLLQEHARSQRYRLVYAIIFCDLDHFKHYNDRNGHQAGDVLLQKLAHIIQDTCRNTDIAARYGGEEFVVICPETVGFKCYVLAERLRSRIESYPFPFADHQPLGKVSVSIGISCFPEDGITAEEVLRAADHASYVSKNKGRNCITFASSFSGAVESSNEKEN